MRPPRPVLIALLLAGTAAVVAAGAWWRQPRAARASATRTIIATGPLCRRPLTLGHACVAVQRTRLDRHLEDMVVGLCRQMQGELVPRCDVTQSIGSCAMPLGTRFGDAQLLAWYVVPTPTPGDSEAIAHLRTHDPFAEARTACRTLPGRWAYGIPPDRMPDA